MSKYRSVNTHFWDDTYTLSLDPTEKLIFLYLLTNPLTNISGIYEISLRRMANDTGIDKDMIAGIFTRFEKDKRVLYIDGYICLINFIKNQVLNPSVVEGIKRELNSIPTNVLDRVWTVWEQDGDSLSYLTKLNLTKPNQTKRAQPDSFSGLSFPALLEKMKMNWNLFAVRNGLSQLKAITKDREIWIKTRVSEPDFNFDRILEEAEKSPFLLGKTKNKFILTFDKLIKDDFYIKILEGSYADSNGLNKRSGLNSNTRTNQVQDFANKGSAI